MGSEYYYFLIAFITDHIDNAEKFGEGTILHSHGSAQSEIHCQECIWAI